MYPDWRAVEAATSDVIAASEKPFVPATAHNAQALAVFSQDRYRTPDDVADGYWPTIRFLWTELDPDPIEIEVHTDHYELYVFRPGAFDVRRFACQAGGDIPDELIAALDVLLGRPRAD